MIIRKRNNTLGVPYPQIPVNEKGPRIESPFFNYTRISYRVQHTCYPSHAKQSSFIALAAISPRKTDSVLV